MFLDYEASQRWVTPRSDKHSGAALGSRTYLKYDKATDTYIVQTPVYRSTYQKQQRPDGSGEYYAKVPKKDWEYTRCATLFRDGSVEIVSDSMSASFLWKHWFISLRKAKSVKEQGLIAYKDSQEGVPIGVMGCKFVIGADRKVVRLTPTKKRVVDGAKRKEIRDEIRRALRIITVREKLGAYPDDLQKLLPSAMATSYQTLIYTAGGGAHEGSKQEANVLAAAVELYEGIQRISESNLESAYPLIRTALRFGRYYAHDKHPNYATEVKRFIEARKSLIYKAMGAEYFTEEC